MKDREKKIIDGEVYIYSKEYNKLFSKYKHDDKTESDYELDEETFIYYPMLKANDDYEDYDLGFYGKEREHFLENNFIGYYTVLRNNFELRPHLIEIDKTAYDMEDMMAAEYAKAEGVTEELKKADMFEWVGRIKNINNRVREIILNELIYVSPYGKK